ncbi:MAG: hypothetical protein FJW27_16660 [Acidimicrobiia bacterium]|nr:hypothetical protein [Acidimicrobiia bacterium]
MGVYQAWNDLASGALYVGTHAAPSRRGAATSWRVTKAAERQQRVDHRRWRAVHTFRRDEPHLHPNRLHD